MSRSQFAHDSRRSFGFLNRGEQLAKIRGHLDLLASDPGHFAIFEVIGLGGAGKTGLLRELHTSESESTDHKSVVWVVLGSEAASTEIGALLAIREQFGFDCLLFEAALLTFWNATGQPFQLEGNRGLGQSVALRTIESVGGITGIALPLTFAADVFTAVASQFTRARLYEKSEFEEIDNFRHNPTELRPRLPHYLGLDILRRPAAAKRSPVIFYDDYDRQSSGTLAKNSPWLREFIGTLDRGVHVISTREPLNWPTADWGDVVHSVVVGELPEPDSRAMIRERLGDVGTKIEDRIIRASQCIPFFLEATVDTYRRMAQGSGTGSKDELPDSPEDAVTKLIKHLPPNEASVAVALASVQAFDQGVYAMLIRALNLQVDDFQFDSFVQWFFVQPESTGQFKTNDVLTEFVRSSPAYQAQCDHALSAATGYLAQRCLLLDPVDLISTLRLFEAVLRGWSTREEVPQEQLGELIDAGYALYDSGYWNELMVLVGNPQPTTAFRSALAFLRAVNSRRASGPREALAMLDEVAGSALGRHETSLAVERAYLTELVGNYARAREQFEALDVILTPWNPEDRNHRLVRLYRSDLLVMDGRLSEASQALSDAESDFGRYEPLYWAELVRHRGHAHRFAFLFEDAEAIYLRAMRSVANAPGLHAKLQTNLAEVNCWLNPERGREEAETAIDLNQRIGNSIEVVKATVAKAIALARNGDVAGGLRLADLAREDARSIGYRAAEAFSLQASIMSLVFLDDRDEARRRTAELSDLVNSLDTYRHLTVLPYWLLEDERGFAESSEAVEWIEPDQIEERLGDLFTGHR